MGNKQAKAKGKNRVHQDIFLVAEMCPDGVPTLPSAPPSDQQFLNFDDDNWLPPPAEAPLDEWHRPMGRAPLPPAPIPEPASQLSRRPQTLPRGRQQLRTGRISRKRLWKCALLAKDH